MIDIKLIRENPKIAKDNLKKRFQKEKILLVDDLISKDKIWRKLKSQVDVLRSERNKISTDIAEAKKKKQKEPLIKKRIAKINEI